MFRFVGRVNEKDYYTLKKSILGTRQETDVNYWVVTWLHQE